MKLNGKKFSNENAIFGPVVIKRGEEFFPFYAEPCWDYVEFDEACPRPVPPVSGWNASTGRKEADPKSKIHQEALKLWAAKRWGYYVLKSLAPTKLELEGVSLDDFDSLGKVDEAMKYDKEKNPDGLSEYEFLEVMTLVDEANLLDADKLEENKKSFLDLMANPAASS